MSRTKSSTTAPAEAEAISQSKETAIVLAQDAQAQLQANYSEGRDLVNQLLGQAQAFQAAGNLLQTFGVSKLAIVKENKLYQQLSGSRTPNGLELRGTWVEFCDLLGISDEKANEDIKNLQAFGETALEQMQRVGIGYRDLRQFRKLPADERTALLEAAQNGDKATLLDLAEDLLARQAKVVAELEAAKADKDAVNAVLEEEMAKVAELKKKIKYKDKVHADTDWPEAFKPLMDQTHEAHRAIINKLSALEEITTKSLQVEAKPGEEVGMERARALLASEMRDALAKIKYQLEAAQTYFDKTLEGFLEG